MIAASLAQDVRTRRFAALVGILVCVAAGLAFLWLGFGPGHADEPIGSLEQLRPRVQRVFEPTPAAFAPIPKPGPGDWLAVNDEPGQTVAEYLDYANRPDPPREVLYIVPVGPLPAARGPTSEELSSYAHAFFGLEVRVLPTLEPDSLEVTRRVHYGHPQLNATEILDQLEPLLPDDGYCMIAVTWSDLYPDDSYNYVFGLARLVRRVGVFSFARLHPDFYDPDTGEDTAEDAPEVRRLVRRRAHAVMSHEIGHMFGMSHCIHYSCNMNGSNSLEESDGQPMHLCPVCLRKLHLALDFDPEQRYRALAEQYDALELEREHDWVEARLAFIAAAPP